MSNRCCHETYYPATRQDPACGECRLERDEYEDGCEGCDEKFGRDDYDCDRADAAYDSGRRLR